MNYEVNEEEHPIITDGIPEDVPLIVENLSHPYNRLDYYYSQIPDSVRTPNTEFFDITFRSIDDIEVDVEGIRRFIHTNGYNQVFIRSVYCSAKRRPREGSIIQKSSPTHIKKTIQSLISQHISLGREHGDRIAVREYIDLDYCPLQHNHQSEIRYFINDGEIEYKYPTKERKFNEQLKCERAYSYVREDIGDIELPDEEAKEVAAVFDDLSWSVDFVRDAKTGNWYLVDMGLNGLYWNSEKSDWHPLSGHPEGYSFDY